MVPATPLTRSFHHAGDDFARLRDARLKTPGRAWQLQGTSHVVPAGRPYRSGAAGPRVQDIPTAANARAATASAVEGG